MSDAMRQGRPDRVPPDLVPADDAAARAFAGTIAILAFLAALAAAGGEAVSSAAHGWRSSLVREMTVQVLPRAGRVLDQDVQRAVELARETPGILSATPLSTDAAAALLEPWFGRDLDLGDLPTPRLVILTVDPGRAPDLAGLRSRFAADLPPARLDDHAGWLAHLEGGARALAWGAFGLVTLILGAAALAVTFATRGALAANRRTVEVLHWVGADDRFIARAFALRFMRLGLAGSLVGSSAAALALAAIGPAMRALGSDAALRFGSPSPAALAWIAAVALALALVSGFASHWGVQRFLRDDRRT